MKTIRVLHVITGLDIGGAEMMLFKLLRAINRDRYDSHVISLKDNGSVGKKIESLDIPVHAMNMNDWRSFPESLIQLPKLMCRIKPDIVQTWMYHADLIGAIAALASTARPAIVWNIRHSDFNPKKDKFHTRLAMRLGACLSHWLPESIICNSHRAAKIHQHAGYAKTKFRIIQNGFDLSEFKKDTAARKRLRQTLGIQDGAAVVGMVGRFHSQKNHQGFVQAAGLIASQLADAHFVLCGKGVDPNNARLVDWIKKEHLTNQFHLLGEIKDMTGITPAFDVAVSNSSVGEGFSNILGEAMACEVLCVATDVGDSAQIVSNSGKVIQPNRADLLATACLDLLSLDPSERRSMGKNARMRIKETYSIESISNKYESLYLSLVKC